MLTFNHKLCSYFVLFYGFHSKNCFTLHRIIVMLGFFLSVTSLYSRKTIVSPDFKYLTEIPFNSVLRKSSWFVGIRVREMQRVKSPISALFCNIGFGVMVTFNIWFRCSFSRSTIVRLIYYN